MNEKNRADARQAVEDARTAVLTAYRALAVHNASYAAYPGHDEASDSLGRALTEVSDAARALADPPVVSGPVPTA